MTTTEIIHELQRRKNEEFEASKRAYANHEREIGDAANARHAVLCEVLQWILENQIEHVSEVVQRDA